MLKKLFKYHNEWIKIAYSFVQDREDAKDIVSDMYIKLHEYDISIEDVSYNDDVNKSFIYRVIKNMCLDFLKDKKYKTNIDNVQIIDEDYKDELSILDDIQKEIETWNDKDRELFEIYMYSGLSLRDLAHGTNKTPKLLSSKKKMPLDITKQGQGTSVFPIFTRIKRLKEVIKDKFK